MNKIHFDNMKNWFWIMVLILSVSFIIGGSFGIFKFENPRINKVITAIGFLLQVIYFSRIFWYKNYVQWNKKGAVIKINSFRSKSLSFNEITTTEINDEKLVVTTINEKVTTFNLRNIIKSDVQRLNDIIVSNSVANA
ncbi:hypothetical protein [Lacinutrix algicola]|uniref:hypothetical protein n=1 Tax=Lacinutrix algicola TaxID=342954 RepID=UPI0006E26AC7|nr:hypothetical protein [Lacinutrix algicola]